MCDFCNFYTIYESVLCADVGVGVRVGVVECQFLTTADHCVESEQCVYSVAGTGVQHTMQQQQSRIN